MIVPDTNHFTSFPRNAVHYINEMLKKYSYEILFSSVVDQFHFELNTK